MSNTIAENIIRRFNEIDRVYFSKDEIIRIINVTTSIHNRSSITINDVTILPENFHVIIGDKTVVLTKTEFELLYLLMDDNSRIYPRNKILNDVWGSDVIVSERTIDVHVCKLNKKLGRQVIQNVKMVGYKCVI